MNTYVVGYNKYSICSGICYDLVFEWQKSLFHNCLTWVLYITQLEIALFTCTTWSLTGLSIIL